MQGDLAGFTCYTSQRNKVIWFVKSPPLEPASPTQRQIRNIFVINANVWRSMNAAARHSWNAAAIAARLRIHGYDLFTWWMRTKDAGTIATIERHANISIIKPSTSA